MTFLLDTHVFLWLISEPEKIPKSTLNLLQHSTHNLFLSTASVWEMSIKYELKKLLLPEKPEKFILTHVRANQIEFLPISFESAAVVHQLPSHHRDPFDRLLISQALHHKLVMVTTDVFIRRYEVDVLWD